VNRPWRVIIVGGGFGGLRAAQALKSAVFDAILSVVESCRRLNVSVRDYFSARVECRLQMGVRYP
jgi:NADH dehydrogenase FAD-containing subunit